MLKFFRKYRNWVLAVGGSVLMVAFLLGGVLGQMRNLSPSPTIAKITVDGSRRKVKDSDRVQSGREIEMFKGAFGNILDTMIDPLGEYDNGNADQGSLEGPLHWMLLKEQARAAGMIGGVGDARNWLVQQANQVVLFDNSLNGDVDLAYQQILRNLASGGSGSMTERDILLAVAEYLGVQRLLGAYYASAVPSDYRFETFSKKFLDNVNVTALLIDASYFIDEEPMPSEEAIESHFEKYRAVEPGEGEYGIGYRLPDRVKFEYLKISYQSILDSVKATGLDARLWYEKNKSRIQPDQGKTEPPPYDEVADRALEAFRQEQAQGKMTEIINAVKAKLLGSSRALSRDGDYRKIPEDWVSKRLSFADLRQQIQEEFGVDTSYTGIGDQWVDINSPRDVGDIILAQRAAGSQNLRLGDVLKSYKEFGQPEIPGLQAGLADIEPFRARNNTPVLGQPARTPNLSDAFFMRVTAVDAARPAKTVDEVRADVVRDLKRLSVFARMNDEQDVWLAKANDEGIEALATTWSARPTGGRVSRLDSGALSTGDGFAPSRIYGIGRNRELMYLILDKAATIDQIGDVKARPAADRTVVAPIPGKLGLAVARIDRINPMTRETFQQHINRSFTYKKSDTLSPRYGIGDLYADYELNSEIPKENPFSFEALKKRFEFEDLRNLQPVDEIDNGVGGTGSQDAGDATSGSDQSADAGSK